jgi:hypothetical protein
LIKVETASEAQMWIQLLTLFIAVHLGVTKNVTDPAREARIDAMIAQVDPKV